MSYKIEIENLGPVKKANIESNKNMIIAGPNGSGKSTIARILYTNLYIKNKKEELKLQLEQRFREEIVNSVYGLFRSVFYESNEDKVIREFFEQYLKFITFERDFDFPGRSDIIENFKSRNLEDKFTADKNDFAWIRSLLIDNYNGVEFYFVVDNDYLVEVSRNVSNNLKTQFPEYFKTDNLDTYYYTDPHYYIPHSYQEVCDNLIDISKKVENLFSDGIIHSYFIKTNFGSDSDILNKFESSHYDNIYYFDLESNYFYYDDGNGPLNRIYSPNGKSRDAFPDYKVIKNVLNKKNSKVVYENFDDIDNFEFDNSRLNELVDNFGILGIEKRRFFNEFNFKLKNVNGLVNASKLSSGQKMVFAITMLVYELSKKKLKNNEKTIIFIDEPELHLHPMLQLYFGEFLALASKEFGIDFVLVTHSLYIIDAFNVFSKKYNKNDNHLDVYVMKEDKDRFSCLKAEKLSEVYNVLLSPYDILDQIEEELSLEQV